VNNFTRRYYAATGSDLTRRLLCTVVLVAAVGINLLAGALPRTAAYRNADLALYGLSAVLLFACIVIMVLNRSAR